jgi:hypothetical protein
MTRDIQRVAVVPRRDGTPLLVNGAAVLQVQRVPSIDEPQHAKKDTWQVETANGIMEIHRISGASGERDRWFLGPSGV